MFVADFLLDARTSQPERAARMEASGDVSGVRSIFVGSLNCLGEAVNPFEFLSSENAVNVEALQKVALSLTWDAFTAACGAEVCAALPPGGEAAFARMQEHCSSKSLWSFFDEPTLVNDNKMLAERLNMVTFAMVPPPAIRPPRRRL